jgi:hypothetical protein
MTIAPWGNGIDRASLHRETVDLCHLVMSTYIIPGFPRERISIVDQGAGRAMAPRPCITIMASSPIGSPIAGENARYWPEFELWEIQFTIGVADTYTITVLGVDYSVVWAGGTVEALRDAMLAEMGLTVHDEWTEAASGSDSIRIDSTERGVRLLIAATPASIVLDRTRLNYFKRGFVPAQIQVNIQCWGRMDVRDPAATQSGPSIAENMRSAFLDRDLTEGLRRCWFAPITARIFDGPAVINQQTNSDATCQVIMRATSRMDVQTASGTQITTTPIIVGG